MANRKRPFVIGFDTEDDSKGHPFLWAFCHEEGTYYTSHNADALVYLQNLTEAQRARKRQPEAWATNLEYDLCNLFDSERVREVHLRFGRHALCGARWRGCDFRDTMRHVPISVAALGELVGLKKREERLFQAPRDPAKNIKRYVRRCQRDAAITYRSADLFHQLYKKMGERPRMTLASTALNLWRSKYWGKRLGRVSGELWGEALEAYHGGRTQAFAVGRFKNVQAIDVASMFPWAMTAAPLPLPWGLNRPARRNEELQAQGIYRVAVESDLLLPRLPVRTREGTIYPNGKWEATYVGEEVMAFVRAGGLARVLSGTVFVETCDPFKTYVRRMYIKKQRARGAARLMYKLMLNALYGKFGQQGKRVCVTPIDTLLHMEHPPLEWRPWNGLAIYSKDGAPPPWGNNVWPAFVTARARVRLAAELERLMARGCRPLYCDTDSVIFSGDARYPKKAPRIGAFESRGRFKSVLIVGKKEYALDLGRGAWEIHVKGVPLAQRSRYLREGVAEFQRPNRIRESSRNGEPVNVWRTVKKQRRTDLLKCASKVDGALPIPVIAGAGK